MSQYEQIQTFESEEFTPEDDETGNSPEREARVGRIREYLGGLAMVATGITTGTIIGHELVQRFTDLDPAAPSSAVPAALMAYYAAYLAKKKL